MAEDNDPASKTEEPSARRLADAHAKGDVAKSQDLTSWASQAAVMAAAPTLMIVFSASMITGAAGNLIQTGFLWATDKLKFDGSKLNPLSGFKRLFGLDGFMAFLRSFFKVLIVGGVAFWVIKPHA